MKKSILYSLTAAFLLLFVQSVYSAIKLPAIVSSNMVLQRNTTVVLWGWADAGEKISIKATWLKSVINLAANKEGSWRIEVKTTNSNAPQIIQIKSKTSDIILKNILFGEVWLCSGQSNMTLPLKGNIGQPVFGSNVAIAKSRNRI